MSKTQRVISVEFKPTLLTERSWVKDVKFTIAAKFLPIWFPNPTETNVLNQAIHVALKYKDHSVESAGVAFVKGAKVRN